MYTVPTVRTERIILARSLNFHSIVEHYESYYVPNFWPDFGNHIHAVVTCSIHVVDCVQMTSTLFPGLPTVHCLIDLQYAKTEWEGHGYTVYHMNDVDICIGTCIEECLHRYMYREQGGV